MKKSILLAVLACMILVPVAFAASRLPTLDATGFATTSDDGVELRAVSSGAGICNPTGTSYFKFDVSDVTGTVGNARLTLALTRVPDAQQNITISLLAVDDDSWTAASVRTNTPPTGAELDTQVYTPAAWPVVGDKLIFESAALGSYINQQAAGDNTVSVAMRVTTCATGSWEFRVASMSNGTVANRPALELFTPTAVEMTTANAERTSWPLYAGLAAVALVVVAGVMVSKRRTA